MGASKARGPGPRSQVSRPQPRMGSVAKATASMVRCHATARAAAQPGSTRVRLPSMAKVPMAVPALPRPNSIANCKTARREEGQKQGRPANQVRGLPGRSEEGHQRGSPPTTASSSPHPVECRRSGGALLQPRQDEDGQGNGHRAGQGEAVVSATARVPRASLWPGALSAAATRIAVLTRATRPTPWPLLVPLPWPSSSCRGCTAPRRLRLHSTGWVS